MSKNKKRMNFLYKISFIISLMCVPLLVLSMLFAYLWENQTVSIIFSASGAALALIGIILGMLSKPKKPGKKKRWGKSKNVPEITFTTTEKEYIHPSEKTVDNSAES